MNRRAGAAPRPRPSAHRVWGSSRQCHSATAVTRSTGGPLHSRCAAPPPCCPGEGLAIRNALGQQSLANTSRSGGSETLAFISDVPPVHTLPTFMSRAPQYRKALSCCPTRSCWVQLAIAEGLVRVSGNSPGCSSRPRSSSHTGAARRGQPRRLRSHRRIAGTHHHHRHVVSHFPSRVKTGASTADWAGAIRCWCIRDNGRPRRIGDAGWLKSNGRTPSKIGKGYEPGDSAQPRPHAEPPVPDASTRRPLWCLWLCMAVYAVGSHRDRMIASRCDVDPRAWCPSDRHR